MYSGCYNCPVEVCDTLTYRGSRCLALRAKHGVNYDPLTHADQFRKMSDEELAKAIVSGTLFENISFCESRPDCIELLELEEGIPEEKCIQCALNWFRQPAKEIAP